MLYIWHRKTHNTSMKNSEIKILLADDEQDIIDIIGYNLEQEGYQVFTASNGKQAVDVASLHKPHLIILDVMMPEMDGIEACELIRKNTSLANSVITFLTARGEDYSQVAGFEAGADDYITKPIKPKVLMSKVKALLRRARFGEDSGSEVIEVGDIRIDREEYRVFVRKEEVVFPRKEFELLYLLTNKPGKVFTRDEILDAVWGNEVVVGGRTIDVHIRKLREKIGDNYFKTIKGVGYKFDHAD